MKMAKASEVDISMAMDIANILDDIERGYFPTKLSDDTDNMEWIDANDHNQYQRLIDGLREHLARGSIFRVIWGMAVICDPANQCIDPDADTIEHHPMRQQLEAAALWSLWHHQGGSSKVGQPIRKLLGIGQFDQLTDEQLATAKKFGEASDANQDETTIPAIVFYPAGSLGEEVA